MTVVGVPPAKERLLKELLEQIAARLPPARVDVVSMFARAYVRRLPAGEAEGLGAEELYGQVTGVFELAESRGHHPMAVRTFTPTVAADGYASVGSIVETNTPDSPFLVDSVTEEIVAQGLTVRLVLHPVVGIERDAQGRIAAVTPAKGSTAVESVMHFEVDRWLDAEELEKLRVGVERVLADVQSAVRDFPAMQARVAGMIEVAQASGARYAPEEIAEAVAFLEWLQDENIVLLGYREYAIEGAPPADRVVRVVARSGLGILRDESTSGFADGISLADVPAPVRKRVEGGDLLTVSKTNRVSAVHRRARMDYIGVKRVAADGTVAGELRLLGLFTSKAYMEPADAVPIARRKLARVLADEDLVPGSHDYKVAVALVENFPLDELLSGAPDALRETVVQLLELQEQRKVRLFAHRDTFDRSVSLLVALPRDSFNAELRHRLQDLFMERFHGSSVDYHLALGETDPAQIHFRIHVGEGQIPDVSFAQLEQEVIALARTWEDRLLEQLVARHGEGRGRALWSRWEGRLPEYYKSSATIPRAVLDVEQLERLGPGSEFLVTLQNEHGGREQLTRVVLYKTGGRADLSALMPVLESLGLVVVEEVPVRVATEGDDTFIHDFGVLDSSGQVLDVDVVAERVADAIGAVWNGRTESDRLDRLIVLAGLTWKEVALLRAMRTYLTRVSAGFTLEYQNDAFAANPEIARDLVRYFELRHDPAVTPDEVAEADLAQTILGKLEAVPSLDQDRILRSYLQLIDAIVRTNAFLPDRPHLSFKIRSEAVPDMPKPIPLYEIFVCSTEMEGIHLRAGKVARGGIRWSDRMEDYRTEVLGLMKTQTTKNAVIVPTGSKGGFVIRRSVAPDDLREEVRRQYVTLMRGLLDVTDNLVEGAVVHPEGVRVLDDDDPYLVVAADKGTAAFSDTANSISEEVGFWLGDAFASGGSAGYDHKALGITARGAWESVKRHFRELGRDVLKEPFTAVGVGDMSGDVFGNGMLYSGQTRLIAAFDHRHVFIDPTPDAAVSFAERRRLYELQGSTWDSYDRALVSPGGGVWPRSAKSIDVSTEAAEVLGIAPGPLPPAEVMRAILRAPVDLFWNGGIGTYVRSLDETDADAGDRANDALRVTGGELRALVVGEGGNLGFTQRGRIEYARSGGRINTDFIDNSAGVDCSDHEVNLKILLGIAETRGQLSREERDDLLADVADDVVRHVLYDNYLQAQILSQEAAASATRIRDYEDLMAALEAEGMLDRALEELPGTEEMAERERAGDGMARPELAVLLSYAKLSLKTAILASSLPDDSYLQGDLRRYFPAVVVDRFGHLLSDHPLRRELIATIVAKDVVDSEGVTFVSRALAETGAEPADVARAYRIAREVTAAPDRWAALEALDGVIDPVVQNELMTSVDWVVALTGRWFLQNAPGADVAETIAANAFGFAELDAALPNLVPAESRLGRAETAAALVARGAPEDLAVGHVYMPALAHAPDILVVARSTGRTPIEVGRAFYTAGQTLSLDWLETQVLDYPATSRWEQFALDAILDDLLLVRREAVHKAIVEFPECEPVEALARFLARRPEAVARLERLIEQFRADGMDDLAIITVALRQVRGVMTRGLM